LWLRVGHYWLNSSHGHTSVATPFGAFAWNLKETGSTFSLMLWVLRLAFSRPSFT